MNTRKINNKAIEYKKYEMTREATPVQSQDNHQQEPTAAAAVNEPVPETIPAAQVEQE